MTETVRKTGNKKKRKKRELPDFEIINLDDDSFGSEDEEYMETDEFAPEELDSEEIEDEDENEFEDEDKPFRGGFRASYIHWIFLAAVVVIIGIGAFLLIKWQKGIDLVINPEDLSEDYRYESIDHYAYFSPYTNPDYVDDGQLNIVYMCDKYTYSNKTGEDIPDIIAQKTGGNVSVLYLPEQTVACKSATYGEIAQDGFSLYRLSTQIADNNYSTMNSLVENLDDSEGYYSQYIAAVSSVDFSKVDVLIIALGSNDFFNDIPLQNESTSEEFMYGYFDGFAGAYEQSINNLINAFPSMQIIVSSPSFFYLTNDDGSLTSAYELTNSVNTYGQFICNMEIAGEYRHVTFVDNFYGAAYSEEYFADKLEADKFHPDKEGRSLIAEHIVSFMYFNK